MSGGYRDRQPLRSPCAHPAQAWPRRALEVPDETRRKLHAILAEAD
jgi:hypothetical protein